MSTNDLSDFDSDSDFNPDAKSEFELPSLEEIQEMDRLRSQAIESLEISGNSVKCQKCGMAVPIIIEAGGGRLTRPLYANRRISLLEHRIKWIEAHSSSTTTSRLGGLGWKNNKDSVVIINNNNRKRNSDLKQLKQELEDLLAEEAKRDKLRNLPLYSCRITGFKFVCSKCYDKVYYNNKRPGSFARFNEVRYHFRNKV
jgi:hypothetical protein